MMITCTGFLDITVTARDTEGLRRTTALGCILEMADGTLEIRLRDRQYVTSDAGIPVSPHPATE
jgi:hypothetical protein